MQRPNRIRENRESFPFFSLCVKRRPWGCSRPGMQRAIVQHSFSLKRYFFHWLPFTWATPWLHRGCGGNRILPSEFNLCSFFIFLLLFFGVVLSYLSIRILDILLLLDLYWYFFPIFFCGFQLFSPFFQFGFRCSFVVGFGFVFKPV